MRGKGLVIMLLMVLLFQGCRKEEVTLTIVGDRTEEKSPPEAQASAEAKAAADDPDTKPLIEIGGNDVLKITVRADGAPGMFEGEDGELRGFYVELEKMIMDEMGQKYEFIPYLDVSTIIQGIKSGFYHSALATPDLPDYRTFLNLSLPYEVLHYVTFVREENSDIKGKTKQEIIESLFGKTVGVQARGHIYQELREYREIDIREYPTTTRALEDLDKGLLDAVPDVERIGFYYAELNGWKIKAVGKPIIDHNICTSFSKALAPSLISRYDEALGRLIEGGELEKLYIDYFGAMDEEDKPWMAESVNWES